MTNIIKSYIKSSPLFPVLKLIKKIISMRHPLQKIKKHIGYQYIRLGTEYGGWTFIDQPYLMNSIIISAGLGEDASFDIEFAQKYNAKIIIIDPTPRAIEHYEKIVERIGKRNEFNMHDYAGNVPIEAYDLSQIRKDQLIFLPKALWNVSTNLKFFSPSNTEHVSHSIVNFQNNYSNDTSFIEVEACTIEDVIKIFNIESGNVPLVKLDIEGAELEVIESFMLSGFYPRQLLVEFDELNKPSEKSYSRVSKAHEILTNNNYKCIFTDGQSDFLYVLNGDV